MDEVQQVSFCKKEAGGGDFECLRLSEVAERAKGLEFNIEEPHQVFFFHVIFISQGSGRHFVDFQPYEFREGSLIFVSSGQVHAFEFRPDIEAWVLIFTEDFISKNVASADGLALSRLYNSHLEIPVIHPNAVGIEVFRKLVGEIRNEFGYAENFAKEEVLSLLMKVLLLKAERIKRTLLPERVSPEHFAKFEEFRLLLDDGVRESRQAEEFATRLGVSYKHLNEICKSVCGQTAKVFLDSYLTLQLKRRLAISEVSVKELAYEYGFDEPTNFVKFFKKQVGESPAQFRAGLRSGS